MEEKNKLDVVRVRLGLKEGLDISKYADPKFDDEQKDEIKLEMMEKKEICFCDNDKEFEF